jgi:hypothetical protein
VVVQDLQDTSDTTRSDTHLHELLVAVVVVVVVVL